MNKKKKKQLMKEIQENLRKEEEKKEAARQAEKEKLRQKELLKEKLKIAIKEREIREEILPKVCSFFEQINHTRLTEDICRREEQSWNMYLKCDGLPDPTNMDDMNYYLYKWQNEVESDLLDNIITKFEEVIKLLDLLDSYIEVPLLTPSSKVNLWKDMKQRFYKELLQRLDNATYNIICNVEKYMENVDDLSARLIKDTSYFALGLWTKYKVPEPCISLDDIDVDTPIVQFPDLSISVKPPYQLAFKNFVVRIMWFKYDKYSKTSRSYKAKSLPIEYTYDLNKYNINEFVAKEKIKQEYEDEKKKKKEKVKIKKSDKQGSRQSGSISPSPSVPQSSISRIKSSFQSDSGSISLDRESRSSEFMRSISFSDSKLFIRKPSEMFIVREETIKDNFEKYFTMKLDSVRKELNLRQFMVIGGVYNLDFLESLPQPVTLKNHTTLIISYGEHLIKHIPVDTEIHSITRKTVKRGREKYISISKGYQTQGKEEVLLPDKSSFSRESKAASSRQSKQSINWKQQESKEENKEINEHIKENEECLSKDNDELEGKVEREPEIPSERFSIVEYDEIYFKPQMTIKLPNNVLWFNPPLPVLWDHKKCFWTQDELDNVEFDNEQQILSFRLKKLLSPIGLAVKRYAHLPFTDWKMKANFSKGKLEYVNFTLISDKITVEFKIKQKEVCLNSVVTSLESQDIFKDIIGNYYQSNNLMQIMECRGLDIFSDYDTYLYVEGVISKQWICESHTYKSISVLCATHNFSSSKWNRSVGSNCIVVNFQDLSLCPSGDDYSLVLITPEYASILNCKEDALEFSSTPKPGQTFSPDLYTLAESASSFITLGKIKSPDFLLASTVYEMLSRTRVCSFS